MTQEELRKACQYYYNAETLTVCGEILDIYADFFYKEMRVQKGRPVKNVMAYEASVLWQMMWTKILHLRIAISGITYDDGEGHQIQNIVDPIVLAGQVRSIFETSCMFHIVYRKPNTDDQRLVLYNLWVYSGLAYRQNMLHEGTPAEGVEKAAKGREQMQELVAKIKSTVLYNSLDEAGKKKVDFRIKEKEYLVSFEEGFVRHYNWFNAPNAMDANPEICQKLYNYFSQFAHPTNVSVFQFADMFNSETQAYYDIAIVLTTSAMMFASAFIADYAKLYPETLKTFNCMPVVNQLVINFYNVVLRGYDYSINDKWKLLGSMNKDAMNINSGDSRIF